LRDHKDAAPIGGAILTDNYAISVIVPTYNRLDSLILCLEHLSSQSRQDFEIIVVDDGSTDGTQQYMEALTPHDWSNLRYVRQENSGPARARNVAISMARSPVCLMIGDDILVSPTFVATHLALHEHRPEPQVAAVGLTRWCESRQTVTRFMHWLDESGMQFGYKDLQAGVHPCWHHFYTSNLSLKTATLRQFPFNETFRKAATEDLELGYRIETQFGMEMIFLPEATASHLHPTTFLQSCKRMRGVGESMRIFHQIAPELKRKPESEGNQPLRSLVLRNDWVLKPITWLGDILTRFWCPNPVMRLALKFHYGMGYWMERRS
jgi:glycosyltransferase involved in cell wall biosynthesis